MAFDDSRPSRPSVRRRPPSLDTTRRLGDGLVTAGGVNAGAAAHIAHYRSRRLRNGDVFLRVCVVVFMMSLTGVLRFEQYSVSYYVAWVLTFLSFFFILPSVLPSDAYRIRVMLIATAWNMLCASGLAFRFALRKYAEDLGNDLLRLCNFCFWTSHSLLALYYFSAAVHALAFMMPPAALHKFWRSTGNYFTFVSLITASDFLVSNHAGKFREEKYVVAFYGNAATILVQFAIGRLCHSNRFKNAMWRYAAEVASIRQLRRRPGLDRLFARDLRWIVTSVILIFLLALFSTRRHHLKATVDSFFDDQQQDILPQSTAAVQPPTAWQPLRWPA